MFKDLSSEKISKGLFLELLLEQLVSRLLLVFLVIEKIFLKLSRQTSLIIFFLYVFSYRNQFFSTGYNIKNR